MVLPKNILNSVFGFVGWLVSLFSHENKTNQNISQAHIDPRKATP